MRLSSHLPRAVYLLSFVLFVGGVSGARKSHSHHHTKASATVASPVATPIVESDHVPAATNSHSHSHAHSHSHSQSSTAQSRSTASLTAERGSAAAGYSQPIYSTQYDPSLMSESVPEMSYYDPVSPTPHHIHHQPSQHQHVAAASGHYHHHVPTPAVHPRHNSAVPGNYAASSAASPYAAAPVVPYQQGYYGYGYDYPGRYVAQASHHHHHHDPYATKRAHGYGGYGGWHPDLEIQTLFFIGIPLIIIPLLFLWPYFLYSLHYKGYGGGPGYGGGFGYRSASGTEAVVATPEKQLKAKTDELTKKIVPKLSKSKSEKSALNKSSSSS